MQGDIQGDTRGYGGIRGDTAPLEPADPLEQARQNMLRAVREVSDAQVSSRESGYTPAALEYERLVWALVEERARAYRAALDAPRDAGDP
jgi:hypothetical protein